MIPKIVYLALATMVGGWMLFDGIHVLRTGKYFGPPEPGPWSRLVSQIELDPFALGPVFVCFGVIWLSSALAVYLELDWSWTLALVVAVATLWYLPIGTLISILVIGLLLVSK